MRVSGEEYLRVSQLRPTYHIVEAPAIGSIGTAPALGGASAAPAARVEISAQTREIYRVAEIVAQKLEMREDVIASLRVRIESGTYIVSGEQIGEMMVRRMLADRVR